MSSSSLKKAGASGRLEQNLNPRSPGNLYNAGPVQSTPATQPTLLELEAIVETGLRTYQSVGATLDQIHSRRLYKPQYKSFKAYLAQRWGISRAHAYRLMAAYQIAEMSPIGDKPVNEHQARKRGSTRASNKITSLPDSSNSMPTGIVHDLEAEIEAFERQVSRWQKYLSKEDLIIVLEKTNKIVEARLIDLDNRYAEEVAA